MASPSESPHPASEERENAARALKNRLRGANSRAELFPLATNGLAEYFGVEACALFVREAEGRIEIALSTALTGKYRQLSFPLTGENIVAKTIRSSHILNLPAAAAEDLAGLPLLAGFAGHSVLAIPLKSEDGTRGATVLLKHAEKGGFSPKDEAACLAFANEISAALASLAEYEGLTSEADHLKWVNKQLRLIIEAGPRLSSALDFQTPFEQLLTETRKGVPFDRGAVYYYDEKTYTTKQVATFGYTPESAQLAAETFSESLAHRVLQKGEPLYLPDVAAGGGPHMTDESGSGSFLAIPITKGDTTYGVICLSAEERHAFERDDVTFVEALAAYTGTAVENAHHLENRRKRALQLNLINEIGKKALLTSSTSELYEEIAATIKNKFNYYNVAIYSVDRRRNEFYLETIVGGYSHHLPVGYRQPLGEGLLGAAAKNKRAVLVNNVSKDGRFVDVNPSIMETKSELCVPVLRRGEVAAIIDIQSRRFAAFEETDALVLETLADQIGVVLENAALLREERRRAGELALIGEIGKEILAAHDVPDLLRTATAAIRKHFKYYNVSVFLVDPENPQTVVASVIEGAYEKALKTAPRITLGHGFIGVAAETGEVVFSNDATRDPRYEPDPIPGDARSEASVPLKIGDAVVGVLDVQENATGALTSQDVKLIQTFADQLALAVQNVRLLTQEQKATRDAQTLLHIGHIISQTVDLEKSVEFLVEEANTVMDADASALILLDDDGLPRRFVAAAGLPEEVENLLRGGDFNLARHASYEKIAATTKPVFHSDTTLAGGKTAYEILPGFAAGAALTAPLRKKNRLLGFLFTFWEKPRPFVSNSDLSLFEGIAFQAAIGVENLLYLENVRRQTNYLSILSSIAADAGRLPPVEELLFTALGKIVAFADLDAGAVHLYDPQRRALLLTAQTGLQETSYAGWKGFETLEEEGNTALFTPQTFTVETPGDEDLLGLPPASGGGPAAYTSLPLVAKEEVLGRLTLFSWKGKTFQAEDLDLLRTICDQLSIFIENAQLFAQNASRVAELVTLLETSKTLASTLDTEEIIYNIAQKVKDLIGADECTIFLLDRDAGILEPIVSLTAYPEEVMKIRLKLGEGITGHVALTGVGECVNNALADERTLTVPGTPTDERESLLCVPLLSREETIGVMTLGRLGGEVFTDRDLQLLTLFAGQVAGSIENARLFDRVLSSVTMAEEHRRKLDATFTSITDAIIVTDTGLRIIDVNPAAEKMLGRQASDVVNRHVRSVIESPALHETFEQASLMLQEQKVAEFEFAANPTAKESSPLYYRVLVNAVTNPAGEKVGYVATFRDVTEAKELAFLKENFIANVSHELRTPLTSIIGSSELIMADEDVTNYPYYQFVGIIDKEARRLRELVDSILDFSLLESRELELKLEPVEINDLVDETVGRYHQMAEREGVTVDFIPGEGLPVTYVDPGLIGTALGNLIKNGIRFNEAGGTVRVSAQLRDGNVALAVTDDGQGIPEDQLDSIFSTFYQVDGSSTRSVGGTGLGLAIARRAVESHGGSIDVVSTPGKGSTFTILLPLRKEMPAENE